MSIDLSTSFGGLHLQAPIVVGSCPMTAEEPSQVALVSAGAGAIVLPSLFQEQVLLWNDRNGVAFSPFTLGAHDGTFDAFNTGAAAGLAAGGWIYLRDGQRNGRSHEPLHADPQGDLGLPVFRSTHAAGHPGARAEGPPGASRCLCDRRGGTGEGRREN